MVACCARGVGVKPRESMHNGEKMLGHHETRQSCRKCVSTALLAETVMQTYIHCLPRLRNYPGLSPTLFSLTHSHHGSHPLFSCSVPVDHAQEQADEIESLESIFPDEFKRAYWAPNPNPNPSLKP